MIVYAGFSMKKAISIYDTTLRDGTQREGISLSVEEKLRITQLLDDSGVDYIEGGWPGSNDTDIAYFQRVHDLDLQHARVAAFGSTCRKGTSPEQDDNLIKLLDAETSVVTIVGKSSVDHVRKVLDTSLEENLRMISESVTYLRSRDREVIYDAEHFFDGVFLDKNYAFQTLDVAVKAGADVIVLCDTNGGTMPWQIEELVKDVRATFPEIQIGIHTHNDSELAVANTLTAVQSGATHVQGTINGYGERCGNANLCSIIPNLQLKLGYACISQEQLSELTHFAHIVAKIANLVPDSHAAYVGYSAFAHKGGLHAAASRRDQHSYQHIDPCVVGNKTRTLISDLSGNGSLQSKAEEYGLQVDKKTTTQVLKQIKVEERRGYVFEGADASTLVRMYRQQADYQPIFTLLDFTVVVQKQKELPESAQAMVKVTLADEEVHTAAQGNGPVNALDMALRKALKEYYPEIATFELIDYRVRILNGEHGTAAEIRVYIDTEKDEKRWTTVGVGTNIIYASWLALIDSFEYGVCLAGRDKVSMSK